MKSGSGSESQNISVMPSENTIVDGKITGFEFAFLAILLFGMVSAYGWNLRTHPIYTFVLMLSLACSRV